MNLLLAHVIADELVDHLPRISLARLAALHAANDILDLPQMQAIKQALLLHSATPESLRLMGLDNPVIEWVLS